ncbi:hypothetical protein LCGC14_1922800 [marine sediment metagenome]|uniref:Uncharacterized protein n=1 Tax=marine sediment metagenome TaxID=412755 RepID=A0A0F9GDN8_9ZZZZ
MIDKYKKIRKEYSESPRKYIKDNCVIVNFDANLKYKR